MESNVSKWALFGFLIGAGYVIFELSDAPWSGADIVAANLGAIVAGGAGGALLGGGAAFIHNLFVR